MLFLIIKFLFWAVICSFLYIIADSIYWYYISPKTPCEPIRFKESSKLYQIFVLFPRILGKDRANLDTNCFNASGLILFEGKQGYGKTISMVRYANLLKAKFPEAIVISNTKTIFNDLDLFGWRPLLDVNNGKYGVICMLDEISIWFSNRNYKNFPPELLQVITQNRKNRRVILGTCQNVTMCDKSIRLQATYLVKCYTFSCITFNVWSVPEFDSEGNLLKRKFRKITWFVQDEFLRECYDTYSVIDSLSKTGFVERKEENG